jgi:hypothetical protein
MKKKVEPKPAVKEIKTPRRIGSMRFTKCGTFRGFNYAN